jgi:hypothetical protein
MLVFIPLRITKQSLRIWKTGGRAVQAFSILEGFLDAFSSIDTLSLFDLT